MRVNKLRLRKGVELHIILELIFLLPLLLCSIAQAWVPTHAELDQWRNSPSQSTRQILTALNLDSRAWPLNHSTYDFTVWSIPILQKAQELGIKRDIERIANHLPPKEKLFFRLVLKSREIDPYSLHKILFGYAARPPAGYRTRNATFDDPYFSVFRGANIDERLDFSPGTGRPVETAFIEMLEARFLPESILKPYEPLGPWLFTKLIQENPRLADRLAPGFFEFELIPELVNFNRPYFYLDQMKEIFAFMKKGDPKWPYPGFRRELAEKLRTVKFLPDKHYQGPFGPRVGRPANYAEVLLELLPADSFEIKRMKFFLMMNQLVNANDPVHYSTDTESLRKFFILKENQSIIRDYLDAVSELSLEGAKIEIQNYGLRLVMRNLLDEQSPFYHQILPLNVVVLAARTSFSADWRNFEDAPPQLLPEVREGVATNSQSYRPLGSNWCNYLALKINLN